MSNKLPKRFVNVLLAVFVFIASFDILAQSIKNDSLQVKNDGNLNNNVKSNESPPVNRYGFLTFKEPQAPVKTTGSVWDDIWNGFLSSFSISIDELYKKKYESEFENLFDGFSGNFGINIPLNETAPLTRDGLKSNGEPNVNGSINASIKYNPLTYWFVNASFYKYWNENLKSPWSPDFSYTFGYNDWHPWTLSLVYSNYGGNRFSPIDSETVTSFWEGTFALGWNIECPTFIKELSAITESSDIGLKLNYNVTPKYFDLKSLEKKSWNQSLSMNIKYSIYKNLYSNINLFYYIDSEKQQPWNPDFTYGFGYFDWHIGTISIQYNNYSGNRYPWRRDKTVTMISSGSIMISWSWAY